MEGWYNQWEERTFHKFSLTLKVSNLSSVMQSAIFLSSSGLSRGNLI